MIIGILPAAYFARATAALNQYLVNHFDLLKAITTKYANLYIIINNLTFLVFVVVCCKTDFFEKHIKG